MGESFSILLIDDDDIDIMAFERILKKTGFRFSLDSSSDADEAIKNLMVHRDRYDCIFLDYRLPGSDGLSLLRQIRNSGIETPVIINTSHGDENIAVAMMKSGAFDYFPKSDITPAKLIQVLQSAREVMRIIKQKHDIENELREQENFVRMLTQNSPNIIAVISLENHLPVYFNRPVYTALDYETTQLQGFQEFLDESLIHPDDLNTLKKDFEKLKYLSKNEVIETEYRIRRSDGQWHWFMNRDTEFRRGESGYVSQILRTIIDIHDRKKSELELLEAKQEAENATVAKALFLSSMSHEIRTPMNAIVGLTDLLLQEKMEGQVLENLLSIRQSADNLLVIINDILDFSKIEAGKIVFESIDFSLREIIGNLQKTLDYKFREKGIGFNTYLADDVPAVLIGDPYRLNQILLNLVGNALKFTLKGSVEIRVLNAGVVDNNVKLRFCVKDTGVGIPKDKLGSIFEQFNQGSAEVTRHFGGTGLGLAITKQLVDQQNGEIGVQSVEGQGSEFSFYLTFNQSQKSTLETEKQTSTEFPDYSGLKFLVVEDNTINQRVITQVLEKCKGHVTIAGDGKIGIETLAAKSFDLVFMDLQMPEMDGYEATGVIRSGENPNIDPSIPVIALTADALPESRKKVLSSGFTDFLPKPFRKEELFAVITKNLPGN